MHAQGLVLDDLLESDGTSDVPVEAWNRMMVRFLACFLTPPVVTELERQASARYGDLWRAEVFGAPGRIPAEVSRRLASLRPGGTDGAEAQRDTEALRHILRRAADDDRALVRRRPATRDAHEQLLAHGTDALREAGEAGIDVATIRSAVGLPASAFHRLFPSRAAFVRACRVRLEIARAVHSTARFATLVARSSDAAQMRVALERDAVRMQQSPSRRAMWQRIETLTASRTDPELRASLARIQRTTRDLLIEQVCLAQARGLIDPALPSRAVARLLDATVFWHVFHELDERRPERQQWIAMLRRIATLLSPDDAGVTAPA
jgi:AcrR family transcriptional regulator